MKLKNTPSPVPELFAEGGGRRRRIGAMLEIRKVAYANTEIQNTAQPHYVVKLRQEFPNNNPR